MTTNNYSQIICSNLIKAKTISLNPNTSNKRHITRRHHTYLSTGYQFVVGLVLTMNCAARSNHNSAINESRPKTTRIPLSKTRSAPLGRIPITGQKKRYPQSMSFSCRRPSSNTLEEYDDGDIDAQSGKNCDLNLSVQSSSVIVDPLGAYPSPRTPTKAGCGFYGKDTSILISTFLAYLKLGGSQTDWDAPLEPSSSYGQSNQRQAVSFKEDPKSFKSYTFSNSKTQRRSNISSSTSGRDISTSSRTPPISTASSRTPPPALPHTDIKSSVTSRRVRKSSTSSSSRRMRSVRGGATASPVINVSAIESDSAAKNDINITSPYLSEDKFLQKYTFVLQKPGDGSEEDPDSIPTSFLAMQRQNRVKARSAVKAALKWREQNGINTILTRPNPMYDQCKEIFPRFFCGRDLCGNPTLIHRLGKIDLNLAKINNVTSDDILMSYIYEIEYCWNVWEPKPGGVMTSVLDLEGVSWRWINDGNLVNFVKKFVGVMSAYYPQRSYCTLVINSPRWFGGFYRLLKPVLRESTKKKIEIYSAGSRGQSEALLRVMGREGCPNYLLDQDGEEEREPEQSLDRDDNGDVNIPGPHSKIEKEIHNFCLTRLQMKSIKMNDVVR